MICFVYISNIKEGATKIQTSNTKKHGSSTIELFNKQVTDHFRKTCTRSCSSRTSSGRL